MDNNLLGEQIAKYRKAAGLTQEDLGKAVGISTQAVSCWECGGALVSAHTDYSGKESAVYSD
ncbi:MAG: helix-turn-helix domain-containing protein [Butyrivibrio sp.]|nr:helix-turn-helix domain-containing protein [Butyrivibrio sp.]